MNGFRDFFVYTAEALGLLAGTGVQVRTNIDGDADFDIYRQAATAISRIARAQTFEASSGRTTSDAPLPLAGMYGDGRHPFDLPVTRRLKKASTFITALQDESGAPNQIRVAYIGAKVFKHWPFPRPEYAGKEPFAYVVPFVAAAVDPAGVGVIPAGGTGVFNIRIQEDADFEIRLWTIVYDLAIPAGSDSVALLTLEDTTYNYRFMDRPVPVENLGGNIQTSADNFSANCPFVLSVPKLVRRGSVLQVTIRNLDAANALSLRMTLHGAKCYTAQ